MYDITLFGEFASYYIKFIKGFSQLVKMLTDMTRDKAI